MVHTLNVQNYARSPEEHGPGSGSAFVNQLSPYDDITRLLQYAFMQYGIGTEMCLPVGPLGAIVLQTLTTLF